MATKTSKPPRCRPDTPAGMAMDRMGVIRWTPTAAQVGIHRVIVQHGYAGLSPHVDEFLLPVRAARPPRTRATTRRRAVR